MDVIYISVSLFVFYAIGIWLGLMELYHGKAAKDEVMTIAVVWPLFLFLKIGEIIVANVEKRGTRKREIEREMEDRLCR
jgi:hypothetical protein